MSDKIRKLAKAIASDLFTSGNGDKATRLVLMDEQPLKPPHNLGGWSEKAMADRIEKLLADIGDPSPDKYCGRGKVVIDRAKLQDKAISDFFWEGGLLEVSNCEITVEENP